MVTPIETPKNRRDLVCEDPKTMLDLVRRARGEGKQVAVVPTMGALHAGHLSLVEAAAMSCDFVVVTIFVNPAQFAPHEDLDRYPRTLDDDLHKLGSLAVDCVFVPSADVMYPPGFSTYVQPPSIATPLEGQNRPTFFRGVATIVLKLLQIVPADVAVFGQKDYQQARVVQDMVRDLDVPVRIQVEPTCREADGLAMSSRNAYLSVDERQRALGLRRALLAAEEAIRLGVREAAPINQLMRDEMQQAGVDSIDYALLVDAETLQPCDQIKTTCVALLAAHVGVTRLIDNEIFPIA